MGFKSEVVKALSSIVCQWYNKLFLSLHLLHAKVNTFIHELFLLFGYSELWEEGTQTGKFNFLRLIVVSYMKELCDS